MAVTVTVLQRIASIGLLLVPAIKRAVYINTYSNYSQPVLTKLYNEILVGIFTAVHAHGQAAHRRTAIGGLAVTARHRRMWTRTQNASCEAVRSTGVERATL